MAKQVGENAAQRQIRLLEQLNKELIPPGMPAEIILEQHRSGDGRLSLRIEQAGEVMLTTLWHFESAKQLEAYLVASSLERLLMTIEQQRGEEDLDS